MTIYVMLGFCLALLTLIGAVRKQRIKGVQHL